MNQKSEERSSGALLALLFALSVRVLLTLYWLSRFGGNWVEGDTARTTVTIQAVYNSGHIIPAQLVVYSQGFLYQVFGAVLSHLSGWSVPQLQTWIFPFFGLLLTFVAFTFYLHVLKKPMAASLATVLLNLQGDFIITTMRGSHEKLDYLLIFVALLTLGLSITNVSSMRKRVALALIYYLAIFADSTSNVFFASTITLTLIMAIILWAVFKRYGGDSRPGPIKLIYVVLMSIMFVFLMIVAFYSPARSFLFAARSLADRVRLLFLSASEPPAELYQIVNASWRIPLSWIYLRIYDVLLMLAAGLEWLILIRSTRKADDLSPLRTNYYWLLILFPAFAFQNVAAVVSDITGSIGDIYNLQIRLIPLTIFIASPLAASYLLRLIQKFRQIPRFRRLLFPVSLLVVIISFVLALIKGASEPLLSNIWLLYSPSESSGIQWLDANVPRDNVNLGRHTSMVWSGPDNRLGRLWQNEYWGPSVNVLPITIDQNLPFSYIFISPEVRILTERYHQSLPDLRAADVIYDNGAVQIYYRLPADR